MNEMTPKMPKKMGLIVKQLTFQCWARHFHDSCILENLLGQTLFTEPRNVLSTIQTDKLEQNAQLF